MTTPPMRVSTGLPLQGQSSYPRQRPALPYSTAFSSLTLRATKRSLPAGRKTRRDEVVIHYDF